MKRESMLDQITSREILWDVAIIGGGATGMGAAVDAASRGFKTLLLEQNDFGKGTSSRSTKLVHGGVRYLGQGDISLVREGLRERGLMFHNAPHLVRNQLFIIPAYNWWNRPLYTSGLKFYDMMAGKLGLGASGFISKEKTLEALPTLNSKGLRGGIIYHDGQFDDSRMIISLAQTCADHGGTVINYMKVKNIIKDNNRVSGVLVSDQENHHEYFIRARTIINATGVFADEILSLDDPGHRQMIKPSQGIHLVLEQDFLKSRNALMVPRTSDGRVMFAVPWYNRVVVGTTDTLVDHVTLEPRALDKEIDFIFDTASQYLEKKPAKQDVRCIFAGLRPLVAPESTGKATKDVSRRHKIHVSSSGLITIIGGKWTTYRKMAQDVIDQAIKTGELCEKKCTTHKLQIHGFEKNIEAGSSLLSAYGSDQNELLNIERESEEFSGFLSISLQIRKSQVIRAVREEMAQTLEDVLARRTRALFLDARESLNIAAETARLMAPELGQGREWINDQLSQYNELVKGYVLS